MTLKEIIRSQICGVGRPSIRSFRNFVCWAEMIDRRRLLTLLDEIQDDFDAEEKHFRELSALMGRRLLHHQLRQQWCVYCAQLRVYYRSTSGYYDDPQGD